MSAFLRKAALCLSTTIVLAGCETHSASTAKAPGTESGVHADHASPSGSAGVTWSTPTAAAAASHDKPAAGGHDTPAGVAPAEAIAKLKAGNARYVAGNPQRPSQSIERRTEVAKGQHPYAIILSCSDSRVPPELVFDAGLGDLFIVRVAGNTADDAAIGSIEYAVEHLGANLIVVLGHERCGAVKAAVESAGSTAPAPGHLGAVLSPIAPAVAATKGQAGDPVDLTVRENVSRVVAQLKACKPLLAERVAAGKLQVIGGRYDLDTGVTELK